MHYFKGNPLKYECESLTIKPYSYIQNKRKDGVDYKIFWKKQDSYVYIRWKWE